MDAKDLMDILMARVADMPKPEPFTNREEAFKELQDFLASTKECPFKDGDLVERNEFGLKYYTMPKQNQVAIVAHIRAEPDPNDDMNNMVIAVAAAKGMYRFFAVNSAYYQKTTAKATYAFKREDAAAETPATGRKFDA